MDEIAERKELMTSQLQILSMVDGAKLTAQEKSEIVQYNSVFRVYKPVADTYKNQVIEAEDLFYRIKALEQSTKQGVYDKKTEEFKSTKAEIDADLNKLLKASRDLAEKLNSVEPMFIRLAPKIDELATRFNPPVN